MQCVQELTMSANVNGRRAAGCGRGGSSRGRGSPYPTKKGFISAHTNGAMKKATFDMGHTADATQFVKLMETSVGDVGGSSQTYTEQLRNMWTGTSMSWRPSTFQPNRWMRF